MLVDAKRGNQGGVLAVELGRAHTCFNYGCVIAWADRSFVHRSIQARDLGHGISNLSEHGADAIIKVYGHFKRMLNNCRVCHLYSGAIP
jgi:hypothetical protein